MIKIILGGIVANEMLNNGPYSLSYSNYEMIITLINYGFKTGFFGIEFAYQMWDSYREFPDVVKLKHYEVINQFINDLYDETKIIIKEEANKINLLVPYLVKQKTLTIDQIKKYLDAVK